MDEAATDLKRFLKGKQPAALEAAESMVTDSQPEERVEESSKSESGNIGETGAPNAYFAAQAAGDHRQTSVEPSVRSPRREAASPSSGPLKAISQRLARPPVWTKWTAAVLAPLLLLGVLTMTFRVGDKQVRLEIGQQLAESDDLEVFLDGDQLSIAGLGETIELEVGEHQWEIRRGEQVIQGPQQYVVNRGENEVLRLEVKDAPPAKDPASGSEEIGAADEIASNGVRGAKTREGPTKAVVAQTPLPDGPPGEVMVLEPPDEAIIRCSISPDGKWIVSIAPYTTTRLWSTSDGREVAAWSAGTSSVAWLPDSSAMVSLEGPRIIRIREVDDPLNVQAEWATGHNHGFIDVSADGRLVAVGSWDKTASVWDLKTRRMLQRFEGYPDRIDTVTIGENGKKLYCYCPDRSPKGSMVVDVRDISSGEVLEAVYEESGSGFARFSRDGKRILIPHWNNSPEVTLIQTATGQELARWKTPSRVHSVGLSSKGEYALTGGTDGAVRLYDTEPVRLLHEFNGHTGQINRLEFSKDRSFAVSASEDGTLRVWRVPREVWQGQQKGISSANTLPEEAAAPWTELINDLSNWVQYGTGEPIEAGWKLENGVLRNLGTDAGSLRSRQQYADFELEFEWQLPEGANSGVIYRVPAGGEPAHLFGPEYQLLDDQNAPAQFTAKQRSGSIYGLYPPQQQATVKPAGEWNHSRIIARDSSLEHWLNGSEVVQAEVGSPEWKAAVKENDRLAGLPRFAKAESGFIVLQDHRSEVAFRKMRIRELNILDSPNSLSGASRLTHTPRIA